MTSRSRRITRAGFLLCCWPGCHSQQWIDMQVPMCRPHARHIHRVLTAREQSRLDELAAEEQARQRAAGKANQVIYYVQIGGHIKIGWTTQLPQRMRKYPPNSVLMAVHAGTRAEETQLHRQFAVHRSHGQEWYPLVPVILEHIERVRKQHGEPPDVTFGAKAVQVRRTKTKETIGRKGLPRLYG